MLGRTLGLDLGSHAVKAVELRQNLRGFEVTRLLALSLPPDGALAPEGLRQFLQTNRLPVERVVSAVPGDRVTRRQMRFPFRDRKRIAQAVPFEVEGETPFPLEEVFIDWELLGQPTGQAEVSATVVPRVEVAERVAALRAAGADPRVLEAEGLVLANLAELVPLPGERLLVDLGHRKTTLCLLVDGSPRAARTLPVGGRAITRGLADDLGLGEEDAERLKCEEGIFRQGFDSRSRKAAGALDRLVRELVRTLAGFETILGGSASSKLSEITLVGGTAHLHRIDEYLSERVGVASRRLVVPPDAPGASLLQAADPLRFAPALALAARGTLRARTRMNFLREEFAPRVDLSRIRRELRWTGVLAAAVVLLALVSTGISIAVATRRADRLDAEASRLWQQAFPNRPVPDDVAHGLREALEKTRHRANFLGVYGGNLSALDVLTEISARVPANLPIVFEELSIDGQVVRVRGHAPSYGAVDKLRAALASFEPFSDVRVAGVESDTARGGNQFSLTIGLGTRETQR